MSTLFKEEIIMANKRTFLHRKGRRNRHHNLAKSRNGKASLQNLILLDENRHAAFHLLFGNRTFKEAASVLIRADKMMKRRGENVKEKGG